MHFAPLSHGQVCDKGNVFLVSVGDSKETKTTNFPLTSVLSIDIKMVIYSTDDRCRSLYKVVFLN